VIGRRQHTSQERRGRQRREVAFGDLKPFHPFGRFGAGEIHRHRAVDRNVLEHIPLRLPVDVIRIGHAGAVEASHRIGAHRHDDAVGVDERQRFVEDGVDSACDGDCGAKRQRQRSDGRDGVSWRTAEQSAGVSDVVHGNSPVFDSGEAAGVGNVYDLRRDDPGDG
jgi:hypothetical protein